jgi:hypothetical protein
MDDSIVFIVCLKQIEFGAPCDVLGYEDILRPHPSDRGSLG